MDEDIDIEEHDLMDNPMVRSIFPDLSVLKKELVQYDDVLDVKPDPVTEDFQSDSSTGTSLIDNAMIIQSVESSKNLKDFPNKLKSNNEKPKRTEIEIDLTFTQSIVENFKGERPRNDNEKYNCLKDDTVINMPNVSARGITSSKLINPETVKASKMNVQTIGKYKKCYTFHDKNKKAVKLREKLSSTNYNSNIKASNNLCNNKIILGSKPKKLPECKKKNYINHFIPYVARVTLQDVSSYLDESKRYCADCLILFPKSSMYDLHKAMFHPSAECNGSNGKKCTNNIFSNDALEHECKKVDILEKHNDTININKSNLVNKSVLQLQNQAMNSLNSKHSCFHCSKLFKDQKSLIEHLYNLLEPMKYSGEMTEKSINIPLDEKQLNNNINEVKKKLNKTFEFHLKSQKEKKGRSKKLYSCPICSQYFKRVPFIESHMAQKHKVKQMSKLKMVTFDPKCKYCSVQNSSIVSYNKHLLRRHKNQNELQRIVKNQPKVVVSKIPATAILPQPTIETKENVSNSQNNVGWEPFAMKSVLFKCNKCDIHFLCAKDAVLHVEHMEMLVNWKCFTCKRIFKNRDVALHTKQHTYSDDFEVYDLGDSALNRVLYNCSKCAIHFTEDRYLHHYPTCELETADSAYCDFCDILVDKNSMSFHKYCHKYNKFQSTDFTIIETSIILDKNLCIKYGNDNTASKSLETENNIHIDRKCSSQMITKFGMKRENVSVDKKNSKTIIKKKANIDINVSIEKSCSKKAKPSELELETRLILIYCPTCKCFLSGKGPHFKVHIQSRCAHMAKYICKYCGITTTQKVTQAHKVLHYKRKQLKLQDFKFYDLTTKKQIIPPLPDFPNCEICGIHFISKVAKIGHECSEDAYLTCQLCHLKLSEAAFKLHMLFHNYSMKMNTHSVPDVGAKLNKIDDKSTYAIISSLSEEMSEFSEMLPIIYSCRACFIAIDTYDKVIEHCQDHTVRKRSNMPSLKCNTCNIEFYRGSYETHRKLHENKSIAKSSFQIISFDPIYFSSENKIWTKHILGSLPIEHSEMILNTSIYKFEGRLKMEVIQDGPSNLTVYKCERCRSFIDPLLVYKHAENSCFKQRKHPCSYCGLPFISTATRVEHEKIHSIPNIKLKSYRIVIFNRDSDMTFNNIIFMNQFRYILYQCRNCNGLVNKSTYEMHKCDLESIRKCLQCGLLIYKEDFKYHAAKHKELTKFNKERIKVILLGIKKDVKSPVNFEQQFSFTGLICDYTFYQCSKCDICLKNEDQKLKHRCCNNTFKSKCPNCGLVFLKEKFKYHIKLHGNDIDFVRDNMNIVRFDVDSTPIETSGGELDHFKLKKNVEDSSLDEINITINEERYDGSIDSNSTSNDRAVDDVANIYKCHCGLHFVNARYARVHFSNCNPNIRASKQNCSKCDLLFTPSDLFDHLLMHHGNKEIVYSFNIINIS